ncbi:hypothetical protein K2173_002499 [Erythroxylum novogranatense]|uniref:Cytochrome P450 n=1 Tax=Erythroxylum novogranatense TaxID=1862640 RepID=A0AAV8TSR6_9ROSI|nr:hypothetical protein K2173_002499 [Erythroxylum novogranatense]
MVDTILCLAISLLFMFLAQRFHRTRTMRKNLPPSPPGLPVIGHLHLQKPPMYRTYYNLAKKYGPIFSLRFGSRKVVVVSSVSAIEECFTKNDIVLANRPRLFSGKYLGYNYSSMDQSPFGEHWRNMRRISKSEFLSTPRLNTLVSVRKEEVKQIITKLSRDSFQDFVKVELRTIFQDLSFNIMTRMITGKRYSEDDDADEAIIEEGKQFKSLMVELGAAYDPSNPGDFFPIWNWIDCGRFERKVKDLAIRMDKFTQDLVDERRRNLNDESMDTLVNNLLRLQSSKSEYFTDEIIKGFIFNMMFAGTEVSAVAIEWTMACLLKHPEVLNKVKDEIDTQIGKETLVDELDVSKLPYLHNVIEETLRLRPPTPIVDPHMASEDCTVGGYTVPRGTVLLASVWALHRDPTLWDDPETFKPERFDSIGEEINRIFIPFGIGRRSCPAINLSYRILGLSVAALVQCFDWKKVPGDEIDMTPGGRITMRKHIPLEAMCKARPIVKKIIS